MVLTLAQYYRSKPLLQNSVSPVQEPWYSANSSVRYCVRPNSGRIEPGSEVEVQGRLKAARIVTDRWLTASCFCSASTGYARRAGTRCTMPRQIPRPVRRYNAKLRLHKYHGYCWWMHLLSRCATLTLHSGRILRRSPRAPFKRERSAWFSCQQKDLL